ncbi:MAG: NAD-dependent epimerase/dehydratase family protein [Methanomassiliicoccales archaeon]
MTRFLIAGGAGFIGCHVTETLLAEGHEVVVLDNLITGSLSNLRKAFEYPTFEFIERDVCCDISITHPCEVIVNLAGIGNTNDYLKHPLEILSVNSNGCYNLLKLAAEWNSRFVYVSSAEIYGSLNGQDGFSEDSAAVIDSHRERSPYSVGKMFAEELVTSFSKMFGIDYIILRPFNVYGDRMDAGSTYGRVIPNFIRSAVEGKPLTINGDGHQTRSFLFIDDFVEALQLLLSEAWEKRVVNIGSPQPVKIINLAKLVNDLTSNKSNNKFEKRDPSEPLHRSADIKLVQQLVDWTPRTSLDQGIRLTISRMGYDLR